ncbi:Homogentisate 1,2-dioxygenase, putative [Perkinsus marinus ATCC 50983]|uniref:homogentisate 1,2-dioxygenase n=1 Tax=Perkinsus marinus (strain ATCC 50983 / TXsc) TaxID=423536 RepID=C5LG35_PERM5|nr:Homogentisate 1,2-dioxygenase, putative [Perkinsus marinus ATCC 50983]EER04290.1 Homogentisate 1,2-dioxygenase, putative [Perkinsus marinus ATCC 50983]|eukprot:XP_002772474.1 Homogentisate 1,2-dioxygenase, putative [Perkinsus marinus ATCC 50983]
MTVDWVDSLFTIAYHKGASCGVYDFGKDMSESSRVFIHHDADVMFLPRENVLKIRTELGVLRGGPREMILIPKGIKFTVDKANSGRAKGYFLENYGAPFKIPDLGPIGITSGLAHPRHFRAPTASTVENRGASELISKFSGRMYLSKLNKTPYDVVGWYGNYYPTVYDLGLFMAINTVTYDHPDPSIGVVLQSPSLSYAPGTANIDFVIFPPRWLTAENTFRPPWFHRNVMSEFMGLLYGGYDAKQGFKPGCSSIHNQLSPHGPDLATTTSSSNDGKPERYHGTLAFMWESDRIWIPTKQALEVLKDDTYVDCWKGSGEDPWERFDPSEIPNEPSKLPFDPNRAE